MLTAQSANICTHIVGNMNTNKGIAQRKTKAISKSMANTIPID